MRVTRVVLSLARLRSLVGFLSVAVVGCLVAGCCDSDDSSSSASSTEIRIEEDRDFASGDSTYDWSSPGEQARVNLKIDDFHHGDFRLRIFDAAGQLIYQKSIRTNDWYWYVGDWEVDDVSFTEPGKPGLWTIVLEYSNFTGDVEVLVETTETPPPPTPDEVRPPTSNSDLLDLAYGVDGRASYGPGAALSSRAVVDGRGRVVSAGLLIDSENRKRLAVWRFSSTGQLDTAFGTGGLFTYAAAATSAATGLVIDGSDRIVVSGWEADAQARTDLLVLRLTEDGRLDASFGDEGIAIFDEGNDEAGTAVARDHHGRLLVTGASRDSTGDRVMILARFSSSGSLDPTFGGAGIVRTKQTADMGWDVAVDAIDRPIVVGTREDDMILWKYTIAGTFDPSFGDGGVVTSAGPSGEFRIGRALAVAGDGSLAVSGLRSFDDGNPSELAVWRFQANGRPLASFHGDGLVTYRFANGVAAGNDVVVDASGRVLVAGSTRSIGEHDGSATLWSYRSDGLLDGSLPGSSGFGVARFDARTNGVSTTATSIALHESQVFAAGGAVDHETEAVDLLVWKLEP